MPVSHFDNVGYFKKQLSSESMERLNEYIKNKKGSWSHQLVGHIDSSFLLQDTDDWFFKKELMPSIQEYRSGTRVDAHIIPSILNKNCQFKLDTMWVNFQKKHEFNPFHTHNGVFSFVVWVKIPAHFSEEIALPFVSQSNSTFPNTFSLYYTNSAGRIINEDYHLSPEDEGTMLLFSSEKPHQVYPFYTSDDTRISISGNIVLDPTTAIK